MIITYNGTPYQILNSYTMKAYIYWDFDNPYELIASNIILEDKANRYYLIWNNNGNPTMVPQTDIEISFSEGTSRDLVTERIIAFGEKNSINDERFTTLEVDINGIKTTVGKIEKDVDGTKQTISQIEQKNDEISASVENVTREYNSDKELQTLRDNVNIALLDLQSTLGTFLADMNTFMEDNRLSDEESTQITDYKTDMERKTNELNTQIDNVAIMLEDQEKNEEVIKLTTQKELLNESIDNLFNNIDTVCTDKMFTNIEMTTVVNYFSKVNTEINETNNMIDEYIFLQTGGTLIEQFSNLKITQNEIRSVVSKTEKHVDKMVGQNLIANSAFVNDTIGWQILNKNVTIDKTKTFNGHYTCKLVQSGLTSDSQVGLLTYSLPVNPTSFKKDTTLTCSCWYYVEDKNTFDGSITLQIGGKTSSDATIENLIGHTEINITDIVEGGWTRLTFTVTLEQDWYNCCVGVWIEKNGTAWFTDFKLEKSEQATDWLPHPDDYAKMSDIRQTIESWTANFKGSGYNLLFNGDFKRDLDTWGNYLNSGVIVDNIKAPNNSKALRFIGELNVTKKVYQSIDVYTIDKPITLSFYQYTSSIGVDGTTNPFRRSQIVLAYDDNTTEYITTSNSSKFDTWEIMSTTITPTKRVTKITVELFNRDTTKTVYYTDIMLEYGSTYTSFTPNPNEIYAGITTIDKDGVRVSQSNYNGYTQMKADGFYVNNGNENVISVTSNGATFKGKVTIQGDSTVPTSALSGEIASSQLSSSIINDISSAKSNATTALNTANNVNKIVNDNKVNWDNAYNRLYEWAYGAITDTTTINGGLIETNTITAKHIYLGDATNYATLNDKTAGYYNMTIETETGSRPWYKLASLKRDTSIVGSGDYNDSKSRYKCKGGETFRVYYEMKSTVKGATTNGGTDSKLIQVRIGLYGHKQDGSTFYAFPTGMDAMSTNTLIEKTVTGTITLPSDAVEFGVFIQLEGYPTFTGECYIGNVQVLKMASGELIVDGAITADKIAANAITANMITSGTMSADRINGGTIKGASLQTYADDTSKGVRIEKESMYLNGTKFLYETEDNFRIAADQTLTLSSPKDIYLIAGLVSNTDQSGTGEVIIPEATLRTQRLKVVNNADIDGTCAVSGQISCSGLSAVNAITCANGYTATNGGITVTGSIATTGGSITAAGSITGNNVQINTDDVWLGTTNENVTASYIKMGTGGYMIAYSGFHFIQSNGTPHTLRAGTIYSNGTSVTSDKRLKTDIKYVNIDEQTTAINGLMSPNVNITTNDMHEFIETLPMVSYRLIEELNDNKDNTHYGFLAQEIMYSKVGSELIEVPRDEYRNETDGYLRYSENKFIAFICGALQEEIKLRKELQERVIELENKLKEE